MFRQPLHTHFIKVYISHAGKYACKRTCVRTVLQHFIYRFLCKTNFAVAVLMNCIFRLRVFYDRELDYYARLIRRYLAGNFKI